MIDIIIRDGTKMTNVASKYPYWMQNELIDVMTEHIKGAIENHENTEFKENYKDVLADLGG